MPTLPDSADLQSLPMTGKLYVDKLIDPTGDPVTAVSTTVGFKVEGHVDLPGYLSGNGVVRLTADEIGGQFDGEIGRQAFPIAGSAATSQTYAWSIDVPPLALPTQSETYHITLVFAFQTPAGDHTDIGGFYDLGTFLVV